MKRNAIQTLLTIVVLILTQNIISLKKNKLNMRTSSTKLSISLKELARMRDVSGSFNPNMVTKYFKNQKPPTDTNIPFTDPFFPPNLNSIEGKNSSGEYIDPSVSKIADNLVGRNKDGKLKNVPDWRRAGKIFSCETSFSVFQDFIEPRDILQREFGNCYFLSPIASVTEFPNLIYQLFRTTSVSEIGYYELVLFIDGEWQVVILDDHFAVKPGTLIPKFAYPHGSELWVMLLEKAWAKVNGGYANTVAGSEKDAFYSLTGFVPKQIEHSEISEDEIWNMLVTSNNNNEVMSASTYPTTDNKKKTSSGLVLGHAYTLVGTSLVYDEQGNEVKLVLLRNPWGDQEWNGDWSDKSSLWTPELRKSAQYSDDKDDGIFYMSLQDFLKNFKYSTICSVKYDASVKNFKMEGEEISAPAVFNFILEETTDLNLDVFLKHWRFNRLEGENPNKVTSMVLGSYDQSNNLDYLESNCGPDETVSIARSLPKGSYVLWVYNSYYTLPEPRPNSYIVRVISSNHSINFQKVGSDSHHKLIKLLVNAALGKSTEGKKLSFGIFSKTGSELGSSCIGYTRISNESPKQANIPVNFGTDTIRNYNVLPPYNFNLPKKASLVLPYKKTLLMLGVIKDYYETYSFITGVSSSINMKNKEIQSEFLEDINVSELLLTSSNYPLFERDYKTVGLEFASIKKNFRQ